MVDDAVDHRGGDGLVAEDASPATERQVAGQDEPGVFVAAGRELEEQVGCVLLERQVADLIDEGFSTQDAAIDSGRRVGPGRVADLVPPPAGRRGCACPGHGRDMRSGGWTSPVHVDL